MSERVPSHARFGTLLVTFSLLIVFPACQAPGHANHRMPCGGCGHAGNKSAPAASPSSQSGQPSTQGDHSGH